MPISGKTVDLAGDHGGLAALDRLEQIASGTKAMRCRHGRQLA